jgi:L-asparaginase
MNQIQVLVTGGTFDKTYNFINGKLFFENTHLRDMLETGRSTLNIKVTTLMMKDSLEMNEEDRSYILEVCRETSSKQILITHGTDTMVKTACFLAGADLKEKTIVLTGAMIPYAFGSSSDGFFNLGSALAFCQVLTPGVYISMNGRFFKYNEVEKNYDTGYFIGKSANDA